MTEQDKINALIKAKNALASALTTYGKDIEVQVDKTYASQLCGQGRYLYEISLVQETVLEKKENN